VSYTETAMARSTVGVVEDMLKYTSNPSITNKFGEDDRAPARTGHISTPFLHRLYYECHKFVQFGENQNLA
jgi:hypothetical protein